jgi:tryptophan synthase alpha chain
MTQDAPHIVSRARRYTGLPIAVGFGISTREQISDVWQFADAAVVGSAIVAEIEKAALPAEAVDRVDAFVRALLPEVAIPSGKTVEL